MTKHKVILSIKESDKMLPLTPIQFFRNLTVDEQQAVLEICMAGIQCGIGYLNCRLGEVDLSILRDKLDEIPLYE